MYNVYKWKRRRYFNSRGALENIIDISFGERRFLLNEISVVIFHCFSIFLLVLFCFPSVWLSHSAQTAHHFPVRFRQSGSSGLNGGTLCQTEALPREKGEGRNHRVRFWVLGSCLAWLNLQYYTRVRLGLLQKKTNTDAITYHLAFNISHFLFTRSSPTVKLLIMPFMRPFATRGFTQSVQAF